MLLPDLLPPQRIQMPTHLDGQARKQRSFFRFSTASFHIQLVTKICPLHFWNVSCIHFLFFIPSGPASVWGLAKQWNVISCKRNYPWTIQSILYTDGKFIYPKPPILSAKNVSGALSIYLMEPNFLVWPSRGLTWAHHTLQVTSHLWITLFKYPWL